MKKLVVILLAVATLLTVVGCQKKEEPFKDITMEELLQKVYDGVKTDFPALMTTAITTENQEWFLGAEKLDYKEAIASEPMISAIAYSVCLIRMNEGADIEAAKQAIKSGVNPAKWICVQVDPANVVIDSAGDVIIVVMSNNLVTEIHDSFKALAENKA